jgi:uncharacterized protein
MKGLKCSLPVVLFLILLSVLIVAIVRLSERADAKQQPQHTEIKIEPKIFDQYVGQYRLVEDPDLVISFWREGDKIFLQNSLRRTRIEIFPESETKFFPKAVEGTLTFVRDSQGNLSVILHENGADQTGKKISDKPDLQVNVPFERREVMIPTRDGVRLHTLIFTPRDQIEPLPILMSRSPYGIGGATSDTIYGQYRELVKDGYIFVRQDIRGRYGSEGQFMMNRPMHDPKDKNGIDESTDTYDTIEWLLKNVPKNNGRVGIVGVSYGGWLAAVATIDAHPALKASSPQAPMTDTWLGDDFFHNGAFRQSYGYEYVKEMETSKEDTVVSFDQDAYDWYLGPGSLSKLTIEGQGRWPTWNAFLAHSSYDEYWKARATQSYLKPTHVATLVVGGWWDQEDYYGALATYETLEKFDKNNQNFLVLGPWNHGGWGGGGRTLGAVNFGSSTGNYFREKIQAPWFAYYLKGKGKSDEPEAMTFETGCNQWESYDHWPPKEAKARDLFLQQGKNLSFDKPKTNDAFESYVSDPANPVPYRKRPIEAGYDPKGSGWYTWLVQDQRFLKDRNDVVTWQSEVLDKDVAIAGDVVAHLFASTTGTDSDWVVKLIDVYPDDTSEKNLAGFRLMVADEIFRGRYLKSFEKPTPIVAGQVNEYSIDLHSANHCFKKGHRLMVQVQSTWFPLYDRNPQKFVENIFKARPEDYQIATQKVFESARYPSHVTLAVLK